MEKIRNTAVDFLIRLRERQIIVFGVVGAIVFSEIIVALIHYAIWGGKISNETVFAGFMTPLLDALVILFFIVAIITRLKDKARELNDANRTLEEALASVRQLTGLLPICMQCKRVRDDKGYWNQIEAYISEHSEARFSHGLCPSCREKYYPTFEKLIHPGRNPDRL